MIRQSLTVAAYNFRSWRRNPRVVLTFALALVLSWLLTEKAVAFSSEHDTPTQILEPFIWAFGDGASILFASSILLLLFADMPFLSAATPYYLVRIDRRTWLLGQMLYVIFATILYVFWILLTTALLCARTSFSGNQWSRAAALLGYSGAGGQFFLPSSVRTMEQATPCAVAGVIFLLMLLYALTMVGLMLTLTLCRSSRAGIVGAVVFSVYGLILRPETVTTVFDLSLEERFRANVLIGWVSPLSHATYPMHNFGFDRLPTLTQTCLLFSAVITVFALCAHNAVKHYDFCFVGTEEALS